MEIDQLTDAAGLITREFEVRAAGTTEDRAFTGIGVPYNQTIQTWFGNERFDKGSVTGGERALILWQHKEPIGKVTAFRDTEAGFELDGKLSDTAQGREAYTLLKDGVIDRMSIGFQPDEYRVEKSDTGDETLIHTKVLAREFSLVSFPAYDGAKISEVRQLSKPNPKGTTVDPETLTRADLEPLQTGLTDLTRSLDLLKAEGVNAGPAMGAQWRSMGDFLKAVAAGDSDAQEFHRAYTGATTADTVMKDTFVGDFVKLATERRRVINSFSTGTLPASGQSVDYSQLKSDTTQVGKQAAQGDDLPYGQIQLKGANAPVNTYGGWTELSRQLIERATVPTLNTTLRALALKYSQATDAAVKAKYLEVVAANIAADATDDKSALDLSAAATTDEWLDTIVDAAEIFEDRGFQIAGLHVSSDVFKKLIRLKDGDNRLMTVQGAGVNQVGNLNLTQISGDLANVRVDLLPNTTGFASFYDPVAIETLESPGAPAQLQDENIINLTKQFSIYGYLAVLNPFPGAILPIEFTA